MVKNKEQIPILIRKGTLRRVESLYLGLKGEGAQEARSFSIWLETLICLGLREYEMLDNLEEDV